MKSINKTLLLLFMAIAVIGVYSSCKKDDNQPNGGQPRVRYVRVTNPTSADSLLIGAGQGSLIAIMGENLQDASEIWFNDQPASLNPTFISPTSILVNVPSPIPTEITNKMKIVFKNGFVLEHPFEVQISEPVLSSMTSEFVNEGDVATIKGNYFYEPLTVVFTGGATGELVAVTDEEIQVRVPAGAQPGPITIKTNFGETVSDFWFRDNRNIFISSDPYEGWWNSNYVVTNPGTNDPQKINGNYIRLVQKIGAWQWTEVAGGAADAMPTHSKNIPDEAILKPEDYNLKFEVNTLKPYNANTIRINVGNYSFDEREDDGYQWKPPFDTQGQWQTVIIPFEEVVASYKNKPRVNPAGYWSRLLIQGPGVWDADISFDNFRVVPKVNK
jgi:hypothetical protein